MARAKRKLPAKPAGFVFSHHRGHSCRRHPLPEHKDPAAVNNTHPTKITARSNVINRYPNTKTPLPLRTPPAGFVFSHHRGHSCCRHPIPEHKDPAAVNNTHPTKTHGPVKRHRPTPEHKKTRCRSEHHRPFPLSLKKPQRCLNAIVQRQPPPAGAQHHLTQPNLNISGRRFTAFFALRCL